VTLEDIARKAGVSTAAVSKALNNRPDIAPATRKRIRQMARQMGYVRNVAARTLALNKTQKIGVMVPFPYNPTVIDRLRGVQAAALEHSYLTSVAFHDGKPSDEIRQLEMLLGRIDGLVVTPANQRTRLVSLLKKANLPVVCMSEPLEGLDTDFVGDDDTEGGRLAARHLLQEGCVPFAYLGETPSTISDLAILKGAKEALLGAGKRMSTKLILWGNLTEGQARENVDRLLGLRPAPKAIFAFSDLAAMWALRQLEERGRRVPKDIALMGYDNIEFAAHARVPLTSISQPNYEIGYQAAATLLRRLRQKDFSSSRKRIIFTPHLVIRASTTRKAGH